MASNSVSWFAVAEYIAEALAEANAIPPGAGTASWRALDDRNPLKSLALIVAGGAHVLDVEARQEARAEASNAIAGSADWPAVAREILELDDARRRGVRIERSAARDGS